MFIFGSLVGSFLNVVIHRLPIMMERDWRAQCKLLLSLPESTEVTDQTKYNLIVPRSACPHCLKQIRNRDNIPVISYLLLHGRCRFCTVPISLRYPLIEFITAVLTAFIAWHFNFEIKAFFAVLLTWALLCLTVIDMDKQLLPDDITLPFLWLGLACSLLHIFTDPVSALLGAMLGYSILWTIFILFKFLTGKEGMGYGDFKLLAMLGAWTGWQMLPLMLLMASILGSIVGIGLMVLRKHEQGKPIPFGPYLALSGWIALLWGAEINQLYLSLI